MPDQRATLTGKLRVLVVDDEALVADYVAELVMEAGHEVVGIAATGERALDFLERNRIDLAILDIKLKGAIISQDKSIIKTDFQCPETPQHNQHIELIVKSTY